MGSSNGGDGNSISNEQLNKAKRNRERKERQQGFDTYNQQQASSRNWYAFTSQ